MWDGDTEEGNGREGADEQRGGGVLGHVVRLTKSTDCPLWCHQRNDSQSSAGMGTFHSEQADVGWNFWKDIVLIRAILSERMDDFNPDPHIYNS